MKKLLIFIGAFIYAQNIFASPSIYYYQDSSGKYQCMVESDGMTESEQKYILCSDIQVTLGEDGNLHDPEGRYLHQEGSMSPSWFNVNGKMVCADKAKVSTTCTIKYITRLDGNTWCFVGSQFKKCSDFSDIGISLDTSGLPTSKIFPIMISDVMGTFNRDGDSFEYEDGKEIKPRRAVLIQHRISTKKLIFN